MGFFDLNIPFSKPSSSMAARVKLATAAMELGYSGVAYNRAIKGVMSDRDRCTITPLTLASLLKLSPALSSSVQFHRDLLGVPRAAPFRQYTRLTVVVDSLAQAQALNSGNPVLKTYDFVSARPLNQTVFDHVCERSEVDIIAIDFSEKLPFRLKLPMVKAAIQRGVYFEITYSGLIADIQSRRQIIANAKLLINWTRGKNLIISSAASTVYELRGPYDVANLSSLLGLSMECAKAAVSKNCRALIIKALRKKQFHKEAVKVELISPGEKVDFDKPCPTDLLKWDPLSSGEGDLLLEDLAKSFAAANKVSKNVIAIDFTSIIDSNRPHGFLLRDVTSEDKVVAEFQSVDDGKNANLMAKATELSVSSDRDFLQTDRLDLPEAALTSHEASRNQNAPILYPCETTKAFSNTVEIDDSAILEDETCNNNTQLDVNVDLIRAPISDWQLKKCADKKKSDVGSPNEKFTEVGSNMVLDSAPGDYSKAEQTSTPSRDKDIPFPIEEENLRTDATTREAITDCSMGEESTGLYIKHQEKSLPLIDNSLPESSTASEQLEVLQNDVLRDHSSSQDFNMVTIEDDPSVKTDESQNVTTEDQQQKITDSQSDVVNSLPFSPGKSKAKRKKPRQQTLLFPLKLKWNPPHFKKPHKTKNKTRMA